MSFETSDFSAFKLLLKQVYSAHTTKVKDLENEVKLLKEQLSLKDRQPEKILDCQRCKELEAAFEGCKKALQEQSKFFEAFGQKFSVFNSSEKDTQESKISAKSCNTDSPKLTTDVTNPSKNENASHLEDSILNHKLTDSTLKNCSNFTSKDLFKNIICDDGSLCTVTSLQDPNDADNFSKMCDGTIFAPDTVEVDYGIKKVSKQKSTAENNLNKKPLSTKVKIDSQKDNGKRLSSDSLNDDKTKKIFKYDVPDISETKTSAIVETDLNRIENEYEYISIKTIKSVNNSEKNISVFQKHKKDADVVTLKSNDANITPKSNLSSVSDIKKNSSPYETSPSLLPKNVLKKIDLGPVINDKDDFIEDASSCAKSKEDNSRDTGDKGKILHKIRPPKLVKCTSKYKMTLDALPLNYKKPTLKQSKLSKSFFQGKHGKANSKKSCKMKKDSNFENEVVSVNFLDEFETSTPKEIPQRPIDIDATFIPENYKNDQSLTETNYVKKNAIEKSNFRNGNLFSNISFPDELKSNSKEFENNDADEILNPASLEDETKENTNSFDRLPVPKEPNYKYKNDVVRKKLERKQLDGFDCKECEKYYSELGLSDKEKKERIKKCSRHRAKFAPPATPDHFWELDFPDTEECKARGYRNETQKIKLNQLCDI